MAHKILVTAQVLGFWDLDWSLASGLSITGGKFDIRMSRSAEIYNPVTNTSCSLLQLPGYIYDHSENGGLACGGCSIAKAATQTSCVKWSPASGTWTQSHTLRQKRHGHVSWSTASGLYLIGGRNVSARASEKVKLDGSVEEGLSLKYYTACCCLRSFIAPITAHV